MLQLEFWHFWFGTNLYWWKIQSNRTAQPHQMFSKPVSKLSSFSEILSQEKQNVFHLPGLVYPLYPFIPLMFWVKQIQEHFFSESPSCFLQSCYNAKDPAKPVRFVSQISHQPWSLFSRVALEIQEDDSSAAGRREGGYSDAIHTILHIISEEFTANGT